jgi:hypothetical protein
MISIFARPPFFGNRFHSKMKEVSVQRLSSRIRGEEIAEYMNANLNPTSGYEKDVCIHVKHFSKYIKNGDWFDFLDGENNLPLLKERPGINVIASSLNSYEVLKQELSNKIALIPTHHINTERIKRNRTKIASVGYIGAPSPIATKLYGQIGERLKDMGLEFTTCFDFKTRDDALNLYKNIDIFVVGAWELGDENPHKIPTKIINAASFGIPTVAFPLAGYKELEGNYLRANNMDELLFGVEKLMSEKNYQEMSKQVEVMAENYHISKIADLYRKLK